MSEASAVQGGGRGGVWRRVGVTVAAVLAARALAWIPLPFTVAHAGRLALGRLVSVRELGLTSVVEAFLVVELVALIVPRLRRHFTGLISITFTKQLGRLIEVNEPWASPPSPT